MNESSGLDLKIKPVPRMVEERATKVSANIHGNLTL